MPARRGPRIGPPLLVDAVWARRVVAELDRAGLRASDLLSAAGLHHEQLTGPDAHIPFKAHVMLLENAARALRQPCFGFRLGSEIELTEAGLVAYVTLNSPNLGAALRNMCRYLVILTEGTVWNLRQEGGEVKLLFSFTDPVGTASRQLHEFGVTGMARMCEAMTGHRVRPIRVELHHDTACPMLARHLGLPVLVHQGHSAVVLDAASLAVPVVDADARLLELLRRYADDLLARRARKDDLVARAEALDTREPPYRRRWRGAVGPQPRHERPNPYAAPGRGRAHAGWPRGGAAPAARLQVLGGACVSARGALLTCSATATSARSLERFGGGPAVRHRSGGRSCYRRRSRLRRHDHSSRID